MSRDHCFVFCFVCACVGLTSLSLQPFRGDCFQLGKVAKSNLLAEVLISSDFSRIESGASFELMYKL